jgi:hypothetical protein
VAASLLRPGVTTGEFRDADPETMGELFPGIMQAYLAHWIFSMDGAGNSPVERAFPLEDLHARQLGISPNTLQTHVQNIFFKLRVSTRFEAAAVARRAGLRPITDHELAGHVG